MPLFRSSLCPDLDLSLGQMQIKAEEERKAEVEAAKKKAEVRSPECERHTILLID